MYPPFVEFASLQSCVSGNKGTRIQVKRTARQNRRTGVVQSCLSLSLGVMTLKSDSIVGCHDSQIPLYRSRVTGSDGCIPNEEVRFSTSTCTEQGSLARNSASSICLNIIEACSIPQVTTFTAQCPLESSKFSRGQCRQGQSLQLQKKMLAHFPFSPKNFSLKISFPIVRLFQLLRFPN
jgi:hypothetical protein